MRIRRPECGPCASALERHGVVLPRHFDAFVTFGRLRAGFYGILLEARIGAQSFTDTVHQLKAYSATLKEHLPGPLLVWGVVEGGRDRTKAFERFAFEEAGLAEPLDPDRL